MATGEANTSTTPTYTLARENPPQMAMPRKHHRRGGRGNHGSSSSYEETNNDAGSLTYSAGSSVASYGSAAGESTDSSFADIMRVLDLQDSAELHALMKKEGVADTLLYAHHQKHRAHQQSSQQQQPLHSNVSVGSSLNYSTEEESALGGEHLLQTITGQPSDSYGPDGGGSTATLGGSQQHQYDSSKSSQQDIVFAPAEQPVLKRKKKKKSRRSKHKERRQDSSSGGSASTPPPVPTPRSDSLCEEEDIWYAKWWMCGFTDSFQDLVPKR